MENPIYMMIVDDPSSGQIVSAKKTVIIVAGTINLSIYKMVYVENLYPSIIRLFFIPLGCQSSLKSPER